MAIDGIGGVDVGAEVRVPSAGFETSAGLLGSKTSVEGHAGPDGVGGAASGTVLGVTVTGSADAATGVHVGVDHDGDGTEDTPGEMVDDALGGLGDAAEGVGDAVDGWMDGAGDMAADAGEAIGDFLGGGDDSDDDDDDDDDGGTLGDAIDNFFGWG
jgi:hypothetical protein